MSEVNTACALRWGVVFVGITLPSVAHLIRDNNSGVGHALMDDSHLGRESEECRLVAL